MENAEWVACQIHANGTLETSFKPMGIGNDNGTTYIFNEA